MQIARETGQLNCNSGSLIKHGHCKSRARRSGCRVVRLPRRRTRAARRPTCRRAVRTPPPGRRGSRNGGSLRGCGREAAQGRTRLAAGTAARRDPGADPVLQRLLPPSDRAGCASRASHCAEARQLRRRKGVLDLRTDPCGARSRNRAGSSACRGHAQAHGRPACIACTWGIGSARNLAAGDDRIADMDRVRLGRAASSHRSGRGLRGGGNAAGSCPDRRTRHRGRADRRRIWKILALAAGRRHRQRQDRSLFPAHARSRCRAACRAC